MPTPKLKPCPFCGGQAQACRDEDYCGLFSCYVECTKCSCRIYDEAEGMVAADAVLAELAAAWNRRPVMQGEVEFAVQYFDGARWEMETNSFVNAEFARANEEAARGCMAHLAARYPAVKYRLVSRQVGDWEPMDEEGGQP